MQNSSEVSKGLSGLLNPYLALHADIHEPELDDRMQFLRDFGGRKEKQLPLWISLNKPVQCIFTHKLLATTIPSNVTVHL